MLAKEDAAILLNYHTAARLDSSARVCSALLSPNKRTADQIHQRRRRLGSILASCSRSSAQTSAQVIRYFEYKIFLSDAATWQHTGVL